MRKWGGKTEGKLRTWSIKNLLNLMRKWGGKPIYKAKIVCRRWKTSETLAKKTVEENRMLIWLKIETRLLDQSLEHDIHVWGHKKHRRTSGAMKGTATFGLAYWLPCLDSHVFVLALSESLAWPLVERSPGVKRSLSAFPDTPYRKCWSISRCEWLLMKAPRCFLLLGSPFTKRGSRGLVFDCCLPVGLTPRCRWLSQPHTPCHLLPETCFLALKALCSLLAPFWWCPAPAVTRQYIVYLLLCR